MCKARDVAMAMIKKSIILAKENEDDRYLMDFVKLHKLMFLGQCYILYYYDIELFQESISAHSCGPYVDGINFIPATYGFSEIKDSKNQDGYEPMFLPLSLTRGETVDIILEKYGTLTTKEIVTKVKETYAYKVYEGNYESKPIISCEAMKTTGECLFGS